MNKTFGRGGKKPFLNAYRKDLCLAAAVLMAALVLGLYFRGAVGQQTESGGDMLEITIDGVPYGTFPLDEDREMTVTSSYGSNIVVIEAGRAFVREADCPDRICVGMSEISRDGGVICCLPHRLILAVTSGA